MRTKIIGGIAAGAALLALTAPGAHADPEREGRPSRGNQRVTWLAEGGTATAAADSQDGPKSSNAYRFTEGGYVAAYGYWDIDLAASSFKFSYRPAEVTGAGQIYWTVMLYDGTNVFLEPTQCPSPADARGWATADFQRAGTDCAVYDSAGNEFRGEAADPGLDGVAGTADDVAGDTAWENLLEVHGATDVYFSFLIDDETPNGPITVDRVAVGGSTISKF